jgi:hypothetical protein
LVSLCRLRSREVSRAKRQNLVAADSRCLCDFEDHRSIVYHTFTNFMLFSIQTDQQIEKPQQP